MGTGSKVYVIPLEVLPREAVVLKSGEVLVPAEPTTGRFRRAAVVSVLVALIGTAALAVVGMLGVRWGMFSGSTQTSRLIASTSFVLAGVVGGISTRGSAYGCLVVAGLIFCWLGDMLGPWNFMYGVSAFLGAHGCFIGAFVTRGLSGKRAGAAAVFYVVAGAAVSVWLLPHVPARDLALVSAYIIVISVMAVMAWAADVKRGGWLIVAGALLFYVSDIFVARGRFVTSDAINAYVVYPFYYAACMMLALSILTGPIGRVGPIKKAEQQQAD